MGELAAACSRDALGRHDLDARRRPAGRYQALAHRQRVSPLHRQRAHRERPRAQLASGPGHARDAPNEPALLRELCGQTHPGQTGRGGDGVREPAHGRGHDPGAGISHDLRSRSGGNLIVGTGRPFSFGGRVGRLGMVEESTLEFLDLYLINDTYQQGWKRRMKEQNELRLC